MTIAEAISISREILRCNLDAEILISHVLKKSREQIFANPETPLEGRLFERFQVLLAARARGCPVAYLTHKKEFFGLEFYVDERVLIPRPETELLVEEALRRIGVNDFVTICDVGTGSGCIAITLAKHLPKAQILATDISKDALEVAEINAAKHGVQNQITFMEVDLIPTGIFDGIIANLPYIAEGDRSALQPEVLFEPPSALFPGPTGLELFERLFHKVQKLKSKPKWIIGEIGFKQKEAVAKLIRKYFGKISIEFKNDLAGIPRTFYISFNLEETYGFPHELGPPTADTRPPSLWQHSLGNPQDPSSCCKNLNICKRS